MKRLAIAGLVGIGLGAYLGISASAGSCSLGGGAQKCDASKGGQCALVAPAPTSVLTTDQVADLIKNGTQVTILDARTGKYDDGRRLPGAKTLSPKATKEEAAAVIPSTDALVVTYCAGVKCPASRTLGARLRELGYTNVKEYLEGISGWAAANKTIQTVETR